MTEEDVKLVLVRYGSDTGLISLAARCILCHTIGTGDGDVAWPPGIPVVDFRDEGRFTRLLGQDPDEPRHNWDDVLAYVLEHAGELDLTAQPIAVTPYTRVVTMQVSCLVEDAEEVKRSLFDESARRCWYLGHHCALGPIRVGIRLPTDVEELAARDGLDADGVGQEAGPGARRPCDRCGRGFRVDPTGIANHVADDGTIDHEADGDHVPFAAEEARGGGPCHTWKCPDCGRTVEHSYEALAEVGTPICPDCDVEMQLI